MNYGSYQKAHIPSTLKHQACFVEGEIVRDDLNPKSLNTNEKLDEVIRNSIAELVRSQRKAQQPPLSQEELAYKAGISFEHLNHIENLRAMPSIEVLYRIARALGCSRLSEFLLLDKREVL